MIEPIAQALDKLQNDEFYYGEYGKQYLSNSDIKSLKKAARQNVGPEINKRINDIINNLL